MGSRIGCGLLGDIVLPRLWFSLLPGGSSSVGGTISPLGTRFTVESTRGVSTLCAGSAGFTVSIASTLSAAGFLSAVLQAATDVATITANDLSALRVVRFIESP
jgi:hypothetical protein